MPLHCTTPCAHEQTTTKISWVFYFKKSKKTSKSVPSVRLIFLALWLWLVDLAGRPHATGTGYVIAAIFELNHPLPVLLLLGVMLTIATQVTRNRISQKIQGLFPLVWVSLLVSSGLTLSYVLVLIIQPNIENNKLIIFFFK